MSKWFESTAGPVLGGTSRQAAKEGGRAECRAKHTD